MLFDHAAEHPSQWTAIRPVSEKLRVGTNVWSVGSSRGARCRPTSGPTTDERAQLKQLERENVELGRAKRDLSKALAFFARAQLDCRASDDRHRSALRHLGISDGPIRCRRRGSRVWTIASDLMFDMTAQDASRCPSTVSGAYSTHRGTPNNCGSPADCRVDERRGDDDSTAAGDRLHRR
jgi:hypothetical protein